MQEQLIDIQLESRERDINQLARGVQEVSDLFTDMSLLVTYQGEQIENIETNIQNSFSHIDKANIQLEKAKKYKDKRRRCYIKIFCISFLIIGVLILLIIITNKN
jgi:t-SNARE complex subunit (syntaxin)